MHGGRLKAVDQLEHKPAAAAQLRRKVSLVTVVERPCGDAREPRPSEAVLRLLWRTRGRARERARVGAAARRGESPLLLKGAYKVKPAAAVSQRRASERRARLVRCPMGGEGSEEDAGRAQSCRDALWGQLPAVTQSPRRRFDPAPLPPSMSKCASSSATAESVGASRDDPYIGSNVALFGCSRDPLMPNEANGGLRDG